MILRICRINLVNLVNFVKSCLHMAQELNTFMVTSRRVSVTPGANLNAPKETGSAAA
jgi:hypothetical protein